MPLTPGQALAHYRIERQLGEGGMGIVFLAADTRLGRKVALKVLPPGVAGDPERLDRFTREARTLAALDHPGIVTVYSVDEADGIRFLTTELVDGETLAETIPQTGLPFDEICAITSELTAALAAAHDKGIIHRDLKPANLMRTRDGRVKVLDFGLAKVGGAGLGSSPDLSTVEQTREGVVLGTAPYMSPEQVEGRPLDTRTDIFSLGVILYEMATGRRPFRSDTSAGLISAILRDPPPSVRSLRPDLPAGVDTVIAACLEKDPDRRFQSVAEVSRALLSASSPDVATTAPQPLVGRGSEQALLDAALDAAVHGQGSLLLLGGEPGVGKTRLAAEVLANGRARNMFALTGHAYEEETSPFIIAVEIIEDMARTVSAQDLREMLGEGAAEIARVMPDLRQRFPDIPPPVDLPPEQQRRTLFNSMLDFVTRAGRARPLVVLLDDLHWADESSLLLLEHLAPHLPRLPVLMLGTYRNVELDVGKPFEKTLARLVRQKLARRVVVKRLAIEDVAALLTLLGGSEVPPALAAAIHEETDGNPFFVTEVFEHLAEEGRLFDADGRWRTDLDVGELDVPEGVRLVIGRRLERLDPQTPPVLTLAAVIGRRFELRVLEATAPAGVSGGDEVLTAIEEAEAARLVAPVTGGREARYEFVHELIRHTLLTTLSTPRRQRLHVRVANALERLHGERVAEHAADLAHHLHQAGGAAPPDRTRHFLRLAGRRSLEAAAADEAATAFDRALEIEDELEAIERAGLLFHRGLARRSQGQWDLAIADWAEALPTLEQAGDVDLVTRICRDLAHRQLWDNRPEVAKESIARGLRATGDAVSAGRCRLLALLGYSHSLAAEFPESEQANDRAMEIARALGDDQLLGGEVLLSRHFLYQHSLRPRLMAEAAEQAIELSRRTGRRWDLSNALGAAVLTWPMQGRFDTLERHAEESRVLAEREGDYGSQLHYPIARGFVEVARGDLDTALQEFERSVQVCRDVGFPWGSLAVAMTGTVQFFRGDLDAAAASHDAAQRAAVSGTWHWFEAGHHVHRLAYVDPDAAAQELPALHSQLDVTADVHASGAWILAAGLLEAAAVTRDRETCARLHPVMRQWIREGGVLFWVLGLAEKLAGIAAAAGGQWEVAERHFAEALRLAGELPHRVDQAEIRRWHAWMLLERSASGDRERAEALLADARDRYAQIGMPFHVRLVDGMLSGS